MRKLLVFVALASLITTATSGCGGVYYAVSANAAASKLEQAREMGAEQAAPFEYYYAREHLREAQVHAAEASYGDAATYAETAETYAQKAIDLIQASKRGEGPSSKDKEAPKSQ
jgi:hypothetical protein